MQFSKLAVFVATVFFGVVAAEAAAAPQITPPICNCPINDPTELQVEVKPVLLAIMDGDEG
ncbi:hypothetical protein SCHPADRAFT_998900 [Schizopora paradoxa]|uniref:Uncharacterized protein n=1 Tax=Schizopora paradoxa TaxID=27342 RepID=A0A0H2RHV7_9AGAM|nr:hypothetical protein SCHPADRAFT_998900 [Schizopora paradoxa]